MEVIVWTRSRLMSVLLIAALLLTMSGCFGEKAPTRDAFIRYSRETVAGMRDVVPILRANNISTTKLETGIDVGDRLVTAFENNNSADALALTAELISAFEEAQLDFELISDGRVRTAVLIGLAVANIALRRLADLVDEGIAALKAYRISLPGVTAFQDSAVKSKAEEAKAKIREFRKKKQWRCKNAKTGRFEKMEFCKANPEQSYVVTFARGRA